jgi:hypothetical protein
MSTAAASAITPALCPLCRAENRIATAGGPTCPHQPKSGADWFPPGWGGPVAGGHHMAEAARLLWLERRATESPTPSR